MENAQQKTGSALILAARRNDINEAFDTILDIAITTMENINRRSDPTTLRQGDTVRVHDRFLEIGMKELLSKRIPKLVSEKSDELFNSLLSYLDLDAMAALTNVAEETSTSTRLSLMRTQYYKSNLLQALDVPYEFEPRKLQFSSLDRIPPKHSTTRSLLEKDIRNYLSKTKAEVWDWLSNVEEAYRAAFNDFVLKHNVD